MRISDWSSDVCSSDLQENAAGAPKKGVAEPGEEAAARQAVRDLDALPQFFESVAFLDHEHPTHPRPPSKAGKPIEIDDHALTREFRPLRSTRRVHIIDAFLVTRSIGETQGGVPVAIAIDIHEQTRSEERRVGKGSVSTCRSRWSPEH